MSGTALTLSLEKRGPALTEAEERLVSLFVHEGKQMLKELTIPGMAEFVGRLVAEQAAWALLAGNRGEQHAVLGDMLARAEDHREVMCASAAVEQVVAQPEKARALVEEQRQLISQPGATPRSAAIRAMQQHGGQVC